MKKITLKTVFLEKETKNNKKLKPFITKINTKYKLKQEK